MFHFNRAPLTLFHWGTKILLPALGLAYKKRKAATVSYTLPSTSLK